MTDRPSDTTRPDHDPGHQQQQQQLSSSHSASSAPSQANNNKAGQSQPPSQRPSTVTSTGQMSFRRQRASRACETCHARKVRCDAASLGVPCTNCVAFSIECRIPTPKRRKNQQIKTRDGHELTPGARQPLDAAAKEQQSRKAAESTTGHSMSIEGMPVTTLTSEQQAQETTTAHTYAQFMKPKFARAPIKEAGRVAYLGESSNLSLLVHDRGNTDVVHYPLPENIRGTRARLTELDNLEIDILHQRGAFLLPPRQLCDELVEAYFKWVAPVVPIINRSRFMRRYRDPKNPPSLLLLQAVLLAGSRVCTNPQLMDQNGSTIPASMTFYKRAKALYDANYEDDRVTIVQALVLMGWYWEGPEDVTKNVFYWSRVAIVVAQGSGMHRSVENSQLSRADKRLWKRIWWTLFTRDRSVAVALGRPVNINTDDSDVEMLTEDDFIEDEDDMPAEYPPDPIHVQFFLQYVKLCEIMGLVLSQQYSVASKARRTNAIDLAHSDMALADWLQNCPKEVCWEPSRHHFWAALLHSNYYTTLCLLHRAHMPPATSSPNVYRSEETVYPSRTIAFQAAAMITSIVEQLQARGELRYTPAFIVYSLFSALIMHVYQMRSSIPSVVATCQERLRICMQALKDVSKVWLVAKMVHTLFESILGNKNLEERLQKAPGRRHQKTRTHDKTDHPPQQADQNQQHQQPGPPSKKPDPAPKRKFDEMDIAFPNGGPTPPVSYERSRPQTPVETPSREPNQSMLAPSTTNIQASPIPATTKPPDGRTGTGASRANTRPSTPFNPPYSLPTTPPDLFLVTRNTPNLSPTRWENFQPDQLFPDGTGIFQASQQLSSRMMDTTAMTQTNVVPGQQASVMMNQSALPSRSVPESQSSSAVVSGMTPDMRGMQGTSAQQSVFGMENVQTWQGLDTTAVPGSNVDTSSQDDNWSNSSRQAAPTTLNVEDWFQFFGINGNFGDLVTDPL